MYQFPGQDYRTNSLEANINPRGGLNAVQGPNAGILSGGGLRMTSQEALMLLQQQRLLQQAVPEGVHAGFTGLPGMLNVNTNAAPQVGLAQGLSMNSALPLGGVGQESLRTSKNEKKSP